MGTTKGAAMLQAAIDKAGSKAALAAQLGVSPSHITSWVRGGEPRYSTMVMLKKELKIPFDAWVQDAE